MKRIVLCLFISCAWAAPVVASDMPAGGYYERATGNCDMAAMRRTLDDATAARRAVITVVKCADGTDGGAQTDTRASADFDARYNMQYEFAADPVERVVSRRYYVEETVQQYTPVVTYVPAGTYMRRCEFDCGM